MIIEFEGLDGSGKSTQLKLLTLYLKNRNIKYKIVHFPQYENKYSGELISMLLRGEFGKLNELNPKLTSYLFAIDRFYKKDDINRYIDKGYIVILDRYFYSNILIQCAKNIDNYQELFDWLYDLEFNYHKIPKPDKVLYLDVPFSFVKKNIIKRHNEKREYLQGKKDIYENDFSFQYNVKKIADKLCDNGYMERIKCYNSYGIMKKEDINNIIVDKLNI